MCAAFDAANTPQARMGVRRSGPNQTHAPVAKLVFPIPSLDHAPSLSCDPPTPRQASRSEPITDAMIQAGASVLEDWGRVLDPFSLAQKVYTAMRREAPHVRQLWARNPVPRSSPTRPAP